MYTLNSYTTSYINYSRLTNGCRSVYERPKTGLFDFAHKTLSRFMFVNKDWPFDLIDRHEFCIATVESQLKNLYHFTRRNGCYYQTTREREKIVLHIKYVILISNIITIKKAG